MDLPSASMLGDRLDEHHLPETNGRIAICRRCGGRTDSPTGLHHVPGEGQRERANAWLDAQERVNRISRANDWRNRSSQL